MEKALQLEIDKRTRDLQERHEEIQDITKICEIGPNRTRSGMPVVFMYDWETKSYTQGAWKLYDSTIIGRFIGFVIGYFMVISDKQKVGCKGVPISGKISNLLRILIATQVQPILRGSLSRNYLLDAVLKPLLDRLVPALKRRMNYYHKRDEGSDLPLIGESFEERLHKSFGDIGVFTTWKPNRSHTVGKDMVLKHFKNIRLGKYSKVSCKSGTIQMPTKKYPTIPTLKQKCKTNGIRGYSNLKKQDLIQKLESNHIEVTDENSHKRECVEFSGSRSTSHPDIKDKIKYLSENHEDFYFLLSKPKDFNKRYKLLVFSSSVCKPDKLVWTNNGKTWHGNGDFNASIKNMSDQLWTELPLDMIAYSYDIDCSDA